MKIQYLGTGASEGIPALFCHCPICEYARRQGGREIRTRAQALIDGELLLDFGPDTYLHLLQYQLDLAKVGACLVTHSHGDHLFANELLMRAKNFAYYEEEIPPLYVYGSSEVEEALAPGERGFFTEDGRVIFRKMRAYEEYSFQDYTITPLPAWHGTKEPFLYLVAKEGKTILYAHDTDYFHEEVWEYLQNKKIRVNLASLDCTEGTRHSAGRHTGHMDLERNFAVRERMLESGIADENTVFVASHICHGGRMNHFQAVNPEISRGIVIAYDGMELEV